jgi:hypothetical protein
MDNKYYETELNSVFDFLEYPSYYFTASTDSAKNKEFLFNSIAWNFDGKPPVGLTLFAYICYEDNYISTIRLPILENRYIIIHTNRRFRRVIDVLALVSKAYKEHENDLAGLKYDGFMFEDESKTWTLKVSQKE